MSVNSSSVKQGLKSCECGCGELIPIKNKMYKPARFKHGHNWIGKKHKEESKLAMGNTKRGKYKGENNWLFKGRKKTVEGYVLVYSPEHKYANCRGFVLEHRLVWEKHNKACLLPWSDVHHKNEIRDDNNPENLEAMMHSEHRRFHQIIFWYNISTTKR